jgi:hypothetical protein
MAAGSAKGQQAWGVDNYVLEMEEDLRLIGPSEHRNHEVRMIGPC